MVLLGSRVISADASSVPRTASLTPSIALRMPTRSPSSWETLDLVSGRVIFFEFLDDIVSTSIMAVV